MPTCDQITAALNTLASATSNPNVIADLSGQTAVITGTTPFGATVSLAAGGTAILSAPTSSSLDGVPFRVSIAGTIVSQGNVAFNLSIYLGDSALGGGSTLYTVPVESNSGAGNFSVALDCIWSAASARVGGIFSYFSIAAGAHGSQFTGASAAAQTDLRFSASVSVTGTNGVSTTVTITQLKMQMI